MNKALQFMKKFRPDDFSTSGLKRFIGLSAKIDGKDFTIKTIERISSTRSYTIYIAWAGDGRQCQFGDWLDAFYKDIDI